MYKNMKIELFEGEKIDLENFHSEGVSQFDRELINQKYIKGEVRIVTEQARYPLNSIVSMVESQNYNLNPDFQRRHRWNIEKKSKLIESFIMNVPIPPIFLYEVKFAFYEVMDGLQRLNAIYDFYKNKFKLKGLEEWKELDNLTYSELPDQVRFGIDRRYLSSIILLQETAKSSEEAQKLKQLVFERLNSGGVKLEPQETRNALYDGSLNKICIKLARNKYLSKLWGIPEPTDEELNSDNISDQLLENEAYRKMDDVELVLRFFAYRQLEFFDPPSLTFFLDQFLKKGNLFSKNLLSEYEILFISTIKLVYEVLGQEAFWLWRKTRKGRWQWFERPTKVVYDPIMQVFSQNIENGERLIARKVDIRKDIKKIYEKNYEEFGGRNTYKSNVIRRINLIQKFLQNYL
jgi:hypothetical protein